MKDLNKEFDERWGGTLTVYEPHLPSGRRGASQEIKAWIAANYLPKQEVKAAIEKAKLIELNGRLYEARNEQLDSLLSDLNLQD